MTHVPPPPPPPIPPPGPGRPVPGPWGPPPRPSAPDGIDRGSRLALIAIVSAMAVVLVAAAVVTFVVVSDDEPEARSTTIAATISSTTDEAPTTGVSMTTTSTTTSGTTTSGPTTTAGSDDTAASEGLPELPGVRPPATATPPTTGPGTDPIELPGAGSLFGEIRVRVVSGGYTDLPVRLRERQEVTIISAADDNLATVIEVWNPSRELIFSWVGGEPGVVNGVEFRDDDDPLTETGSYVIRVVSTGQGGDFLLRFFGED